MFQMQKLSPLFDILAFVCLGGWAEGICSVLRFCEIHLCTTIFLLYIDWVMVSILFCASQSLIPGNWLWCLWMLSGIKSLCKYSLGIYEVWLMIFAPFWASLIWLRSAAAYWVKKLDVIHKQLMVYIVVMYIDWAFVKLIYVSPYLFYI